MADLLGKHQRDSNSSSRIVDNDFNDVGGGNKRARLAYFKPEEIKAEDSGTSGGLVDNNDGWFPTSLFDDDCGSEDSPTTSSNAEVERLLSDIVFDESDDEHSGGGGNEMETVRSFLDAFPASPTSSLFFHDPNGE